MFFTIITFSLSLICFFTLKGGSALIIREIRLPRLLLSLAVGASLSVSGAAFQALFRNSLADPYIIGSSSGAALGAGLVMAAGVSLNAVTSGQSAGSLGVIVPLAAFAGSLAAVLIAFTLAGAAGNPPPAAALLLAGVCVGAFCQALLSFVLVLKDRALGRVYYWLLGSFAGASWPLLALTVPLMAAGCVLVFAWGDSLDLLMQGDDTARSLGLNAERRRFLVTLAASLSTAAAVSSAGVLGFVGLIAPHASRLVTGPVHRRLLPACALSGALLASLADLASHRLIYPLELPAGILTSLAGAPFFLLLLAKQGRSLGKQ